MTMCVYSMAGFRNGSARAGRSSQDTSTPVAAIGPHSQRQIGACRSKRLALPNWCSMRAAERGSVVRRLSRGWVLLLVICQMRGASPSINCLRPTDKCAHVLNYKGYCDDSACKPTEKRSPPAAPASRRRSSVLRSLKLGTLAMPCMMARGRSTRCAARRT